MKDTSKYNPYISSLKGVAILAILYIHLVDWSNITLSPLGQNIKEITYILVFMFMALVGSLVYISYQRYEDLARASKRNVVRGLQLLGIYFGYSLLKLYIYDFNQQPFYQQFIKQGIFDAQHILTLKAFSTPMSILFTIGSYLILSPLILWLTKKLPKPHWWILGLTSAILFVNYVTPLPHNAVADFLYARGNITFPLLLWFPVFLLGYWLAMVGFEKYRTSFALLFGLPTIYWIWYLVSHHLSWIPRDYMYPLRPYYIVFSLAVMYVLINIFYALERMRALWVKWLLVILKNLGTHTLEIYVGHIVVMDLTLWVTYPEARWIWLTVLGALTGYIILKTKSLKVSGSLS